MISRTTDWDAYYRKPASTAAVTRRISAAKILRTLAPHLAERSVRICELGGGNSCFIDSFLRLANVIKYDVVDLNAHGVRLLQDRFPSDPRVSARVGDALEIEPGLGQYDIVYSVGLIEHFDPQGTAKCIDAHFCLCRPGGAVLVTFPTPTPPYNAIRKFAEILGIWRFPDERPLAFDEVVGVCSRHGTVTHCSINWAIGLTQGYVLTACPDDRAAALPMSRV